MKKYSTEEIEKYLEGQMSTEDMQAIEQAIANNQELKEEVELQKKLIKSLGMIAFMGAMQQAHARNISNIQSPVEPTNTTQGLTGKAGFSVFKTIIVAFVGISALVGIVKLIQSKKELTPQKNESTRVNAEF